MDDDGGSGGGDSNKKEGENNFWSSYVSPTLLSALLKFSHLGKIGEKLSSRKGNNSLISQ